MIRVIRLIRIDGQIEEGVVHFAFFNTISELFYNIAGEEVWETEDELREAIVHDCDTDAEFAARMFRLLHGED